MTGAAAPDSRRVVGLDGIRGLAALFVVVHHCWLMTFHGYPRNTGPKWLGFLLYGHFAVVVFITLSGFSLAVSPARKKWQLGGNRLFAQRRAWRILPPYWAALAFSMAVTLWSQVPEPASALPNGKSVVVYGLLVQDIFASPVPNGAFWSIAVEAQLYFVFPLLILFMRRYGWWAVLATSTLPVIAIGLLAPHVHVVYMLLRLTPQFAPLFALGLIAAGVISAPERIRRLPLQWLALLAALPVLVLILVKHSTWTVNHYFWIDILVGPAIALMLAAVATRRPAPLVWLLGTRPVRSLGLFSYSLYLVHAPIVVIIARKFVAPHVAPGLPAFWVTLAVAVPVSLVFARVFAAFFEIPFQRYRSWTALRDAVRARLRPAPTRALPIPSPRPEPTPAAVPEPSVSEP